MVRAESLTATLVYTYTADGLRVVQSVDGAATAFTWDWAAGVPELLYDGRYTYLIGHDTLGWEGARTPMSPVMRKSAWRRRGWGSPGSGSMRMWGCSISGRGGWMSGPEDSLAKIYGEAHNSAPKNYIDTYTLLPIPSTKSILRTL